jgi:hypothetical protein
MFIRNTHLDEELPFNLLRELQTAGIANIIEDD